MPLRPPADPSYGIGLDLVSVERLSRLLKDHPAAEEELFTRSEVAYCSRKRRRDEHLAARFAAKEAVLKAFGSGLSSRMSWTEVEIVNDRLGGPSVRLSGEVARRAARRGLRQVSVSLSHSAGLAIAQALAVYAPAPRGA